MKKIFLIVLSILFFCLSGCIGGPSVCDSINPGDSAFCDSVANSDWRIEDVGNAFIVANAIAIGQGVYTKEDAIEICEHLIKLLEDPITYAVFRSNVVDELSDYPELMDVLNSYVDIAVSDINMYETDRKILTDWLNDRIKGMSQ